MSVAGSGCGAQDVQGLQWRRTRQEGGAAGDGAHGGERGRVAAALVQEGGRLVVGQRAQQRQRARRQQLHRP